MGSISEIYYLMWDVRNSKECEQTGCDNINEGNGLLISFVVVQMGSIWIWYTVNTFTDSTPRVKYYGLFRDLNKELLGIIGKNSGIYNIRNLLQCISLQIPFLIERVIIVIRWHSITYTIFHAFVVLFIEIKNKWMSNISIWPSTSRIMNVYRSI